MLEGEDICLKTVFWKFQTSLSQDKNEQLCQVTDNLSITPNLPLILDVDFRKKNRNTFK